MNKNNISQKTAHSAVFVGMEDIGAIIEERVADGQSVELSPRGVSMLPLIREGKDSVILSPKPERLRKYDIPLYSRADGSYILHRVVGFSGDTYIMCGDNQYVMERGVPHSRVVAVVSKIIRGGRLIGVNDPIYRLYTIAWCVSRPLRHLALRVLRRIKRIFTK